MIIICFIFLLNKWSSYTSRLHTKIFFKYSWLTCYCFSISTNIILITISIINTIVTILIITISKIWKIVELSISLRFFCIRCLWYSFSSKIIKTTRRTILYLLFWSKFYWELNLFINITWTCDKATSSIFSELNRFNKIVISFVPSRIFKYCMIKYSPFRRFNSVRNHHII